MAGRGDGPDGEEEEEEVGESATILFGLVARAKFRSESERGGSERGGGSARRRRLSVATTSAATGADEEVSDVCHCA